MGRKIPGKKHRGVKDPMVQQARRNEQQKINAAPQNPDEQEVPKSLLEIQKLMKLAEERSSKNSKIKKKKPTKRFKMAQKVFGSKAAGIIHDENPNESEATFLNRMRVATDELINEANLESKFQVKVKRNEFGQVGVEKAKLIDKILTKNKKNTNGGNEKKVKRLSKDKRHKLKKNKNVEEEKLDSMGKKYDHVKFGEVVHEPPNLNRLPRGVNKDQKKKKELLLNSILGENSTPNLSMARKQQIEKQRLEVVAAYREMKAQKYKKV